MITAKLKVIELVRPKKSCRCCEKMVQAPAPSCPIPGSMAGGSLLAYVLVSKFDDHLPLYRQKEGLARMGADIHTEPTFRIVMAPSMSSGRSATASRGCGISSLMVVMSATSSGKHSPVWANGPSRSSSDPTPSKDSTSCPGAGSWNAPSHGSAAAAGSPRTGKRPSLPQPPGPLSPPSACSHAEPQNIALLDQLSNQMGWLPPSPDGIAMCQGSGVYSH
jgi:hypothetical protein